VERTEKVVGINHYDAAVRDPEVQSCAVFALLKSQSFEQVINKPVRVVGGLFGAIPQPPGPVAGRVLVFNVERFLQGAFRKVIPFTRI